MTSDKSLPITKPTLVRSRSGDDLPIGSMANSTQFGKLEVIGAPANSLKELIRCRDR